MSCDLYFIKVDDKNQHDYNIMVDEAIHMYIQIFSDPPYNEKFDYNDVKTDFDNFISKGCLLLAVQDNIAIGFLCASIGIHHECNPEILQQYKDNGIDVHNDVYIAELGVDKNYRNQKIGKKLVSELIQLYKHNNMFLRTGVENNDMVIHFYEKFDFIITDIREMVENTRSDGSTATDERLYMVKYTSTDLPIYVKQDEQSSTIDFGYQSGAENLYGIGDNTHNTCHDDYDYNSGAEEFYGK